MVDVVNLYADDSGSRKPDRKHDHGAGCKWFGLGGVLIRERDEDRERARHAEFMAAWPELAGAPLHSADIRSRSDAFRWLGRDEERTTRFFEQLTTLICESTIVCLAAVVDRAGYRARYEDRYRQPHERWLLCKTAFAILVERAAKYAQERGCRLRVLVERSDKETDNRMRRYYEELRKQGLPFDAASMAHYGPLPAPALAETLYEFDLKHKSSPLMQLADLCLYPVCRAAYDASYRSFLDLVRFERLIDACIPASEIHSRGIKYSCFPQLTTTRTILGMQRPEAGQGPEAQDHKRERDADGRETG
jgi:hypothetical protein